MRVFYLSHWFEVSKDLPVHVGVYHVKGRKSKDSEVSYWDGYAFIGRWLSIDGSNNGRNILNGCQITHWRGVRRK